MAEFDPQSAVDFIRDNAPALAEAKGQRVLLEESLRSTKALEMKKHPALPISAQEREAYASDAYRTHLLGLQAAVEREEKLKWLMTAAQARVEVWRSSEASARAEGRAVR